MKITKIKIKNLFGISESELDGRNIELSGDNGTGKTSVIDSIRYALTNDSDREYIIKNGEKEGEILVETDTDLYINRKKRTDKVDYKSVKENGREVGAPESLLKQLFTPLQLNPVEFTQMSPKEQNRIILDLIEFDWDLNWIKEQFGEIPPDVNYEQNILQVLNDIQSDTGYYFRTRQDVNRDIRNKKAFCEDISEDIPEGYQAEKWQSYSLADKYKELEKNRAYNSKIEKARATKESFNNRKRGLEATRDIEIAAEEKEIAAEREHLATTLERLKAEILRTEEKMEGLSGKLESKKLIAESSYKESLAKLEKEFSLASDYANKSQVDVSELQSEIATAEEMKKYLNEYGRLVNMQDEIELLDEESRGLTDKIEKARMLPGEILKTATIPVKGLTVEDGIPLINNLPVTNLSEGEKLELCIDVALSKPNNLQLILIDGAERLSDNNRERLYAKCKDKGLQFIATRTANTNEMEINYL